MKKGQLSATSSYAFVGQSMIEGKGVFAADNIPAGTVIGSFQGYQAQRQSKFVLTTEDNKGQPYLLRVTNEFRYLNHHKNPNLEIRDDLSLVTTRPVRMGRELFINYGPEFQAAIS